MKWITSKKAREILKCSRQRLYQLYQTGRIKRKKIGSSFIYSLTDIIEYADSPKNKGGRPRKDDNNARV